MLVTKLVLAAEPCTAENSCRWSVTLVEVTDCFDFQGVYVKLSSLTAGKTESLHCTESEILTLGMASLFDYSV